MGTILVQVVLVEYGGSPVSCVQLNSSDNFKCISISFSMIIIGVLVKFIPDSLFKRFAQKSKRCTLKKKLQNFSLTVSRTLSETSLPVKTKNLRNLLTKR